VVAEDEAAVWKKLMRQIAEFVAVLSCSLFTGSAVYGSLVEHPARIQCRVEVAATEFPAKPQEKHWAGAAGNYLLSTAHLLEWEFVKASPSCSP